MTALTKAIVSVGERLTWNQKIIVDKHSVGELPGNCTVYIGIVVAKIDREKVTLHIEIDAIAR